MSMFGLVFLKTNPKIDEEANKEDDDFWANWFTDLQKNNPQCSNCWASASKNNDKPCRKENLKVIASGSMFGAFDYIIIVEVENIIVIENFVIKCLRKGFKSIIDTQTFLGRKIS